MTMIRTRWAAVGAAVAVTLGTGGLAMVDAAKTSGERAVYTAIEPCRVADTRTTPPAPIGPKTTPMAAGEVHTVAVHGDNGQCTGIPDDVIAVGLNVTPVEASQPTFLTLWAGDPGTVPNASSLNPTPGEPPTPNAVTVELDGDGAFNVYNFQGTVDLVIDVVGIYQDHRHDDRYFTKSQSDARYASPDAIDNAVADAASEVISFPPYVAASDQFDYVPEATAPASLTTTFTTTRAGYIEVSKYAAIGTNCSGSQIFAVFLSIDGTGLASSGQLVEATNTFSGQLSGITDTVMPAGEHELRVAVECLGDTNEASGVGATDYSTGFAIVHPAG